MGTNYFSDKYRELRDKHGSNITAQKIAILTNGNINTIRGYLNGGSKKQIPPEFPKQCATLMGLDQKETKELIDAAEKDIFGAAEFKRKEAVIDFLNSLQEGIFVAEESSSAPKFSTTLSTDEPIVTLSTPVQLTSALEMLCQNAESNEEVFFFLPGTFPDLGRILCENSDKKITQLFSLIYLRDDPDGGKDDPDGGKVILSFLRHLIPALYSCSKYNTYYYYNKGGDVCVPFPWFACTSKNVLIVSEDRTSGVLLRSEKAAKLYQIRFSDLLCRSDRFVKTEAPGAAALKYYRDLMDDLHKPAYNLELATCLILFISDFVLDSLKEQMSDRIPPQLSAMLDLFKEHIHKLQEGYKEYEVITYFTEGGIRDFIETGWIQSLPEEILPIPPHLRLRILQKMLEDFDQYELYMLQKEFPADTMKFRVYVCGTRGYIQLCDRKNNTLTLDIVNNSLLEMLSSYFQIVGKSPNFAWSKAESKRRLAKLVEECDKMVPRTKAKKNNP